MHGLNCNKFGVLLQVIHVPGYTQEEKVEIATRHLIPKQLQVWVSVRYLEGYGSTVVPLLSELRLCSNNWLIEVHYLNTELCLNTLTEHTLKTNYSNITIISAVQVIN